MSKIYVGDIGTKIIVDCGTSLAGATVHNIIVKKPDWSISTWTATIDENTLVYYTVEGDFDIPGAYGIQASVIVDGWSGLGETTSIDVYPAWK